MIAKRRPMTIAEVLAVLRAGEEPDLAGHYAYDPRPLTLDEPASRVSDYWMSEGALTWRGAADALNGKFGVNASYEVWGTLLRNRSGATVGDVCAFLSSIAFVPEIADEVVLGRRCRAAGAFMTIRDLLLEAGESPDRIAPATRLSELRPKSVLTLMDDLYRCGPAQVLPFWPSSAIGDGWLLLGAAIAVMGSPVSFLFLFETQSAIALAVFLGFAALLTGCCYRSWSNLAAPHALRFDRPASLKDIARALALAA